MRQWKRESLREMEGGRVVLVFRMGMENEVGELWGILSRLKMG